MKKIKKLIFLLVMLVATGYDCLAQVTYCATPRTSANPTTQTLNYTCRNVSGTTYEMKLEFANATTGTVNPNIGSNPGGVNVAANPVWSNGNKTLTYQFTSASTPTLFVATIFVNIGGEVRWDLPLNANFAATCLSTPVLTTTGATGVGNTVGTMNGNISSNGASDINSYGFYWSTTNGFADGTGTQVVKGTTAFTGNIAHELTLLTESTPYYYKAYATNSSGTAYGAQQTFTTTSSLPAPALGTFTVGTKLTTDPDFTITPPTSNSSGTFSYTSSNTAVATIVSGNQIHIVGAGTSTITATQAATASYSSGSTTATLTVNVGGVPSVAATVPPARNSWDVISLYSGAYTTLVGATWQTGTNVDIVGNQTRYFANMLNQRLAFPPTDISAMTHMHIDVYSATLNPTWFELQGVRVSKATPINGWASIDIALSEFGALGLTAISFFDLNNPTGAVAPADNVYVDNVYFYRAATLQPPTFSTTFTVPAKVFGDADFTLTPPTSNSSGAFSYTSSNTGVATIVNGNQIHIVAAGSSTITVTQAATATYGSKSATATFVVNHPPLTVAAPTPPARAAGDVISYYSGAYAVEPGGSWSAGGTIADVTPGGNAAKYVTNFTSAQVAFPNKNVSGMTHIHIDVYSLDTTVLWLWVGTNRKDITTIVNGWASIDIPLSQYSAIGVNLNAVNIVKIENPQGAGTLRNMYVDNVYFWKPAAALINPTITNFPNISKLLGDAPFSLTQPTSDSSGAFTYVSSNTGVATISGSTVTIVGAGTSTITANQAVTATHNAGSITATLTVTVPPLTTPAPTPPARNAWDVISCYSDAYTNIAPTPTWSGNATISDVSLQGNATKFLENYVLGQIGFANTNVSAMSTLHFDIHSRDYGTVWVRLNNVQYVATTPLYNWASFDIPLSSFAGAPLTAINNIQFVSPTGAVIPLKNIYVDNIYFYRAPTLEPPTITGFSIPAKTAGDPAFAITPPTSNSNGAFTYTSSSPSVATVSGNIITIVGGGTATITATQAATASYAAGSVTAQFVVAFGPPTASPALYPRTPDRYVSMYTGSPTVYPTTINAQRASWSSAAMSSIPNGTNNCLKLENFGYLGLVNQGNANFSVEGMTNLHLDVYLNAPLTGSPATSRVFVSLLWGTTSEQSFEKTNLVAGWNSINIDLSQYTNADLTQIYGIKLEQNTAAPTQIYLDNVFFSNDCYTYYADTDGDGYGDDNTAIDFCGIIPGAAIVGGDCDDSNPTTYPNATEICYNGIDDDCDGFFSEGCAPVLTHIANSLCGTTLPNVKSTITATIATYSGPFTVSYLFRITNLTANPQVTVDLPRAFRNFNLGMTDIRAYGSQYSVMVAAVINGEQQPFSAPCLITTPSIPTSKLAQCGGTATSMSSSVTCNAVPYALAYQFEVAQQSNLGTVKEIVRLYNNFSMILVTNGPNALPLLYDTNYVVRVKVKVLIDGEEVWGQYGVPCTITTPPAPEAFMTTCGETAYTPASINTILFANNIAYTTMYRFTLLNEELGYAETVEHPFNSFRLSDFDAITPLVPDETYSIIVDAMIFGNYYAGKDCQIKVPYPAKTRLVEEAFEAKAYPNPFANDFLIDVITESKSPVSIKVYDMVGRLVDQQQVAVTNLGTSSVGSQYPSGVYNVVITQDETVKTLRVVKR